jgi:glycosyltransferase involved in cell wall biosynthesis
MRVSVVIPTFNRSGLLRQTVPALAHQQITPDLAYEVIFVSNGSTDDTELVLREAERQYPGVIRYFRIEPTGGPSAPRNVGIRSATGEILVLLDDDVQPDPDLVLRYAEFHRKHPERHHAAIGESYVPDHLLSDPMSLFHVFPYDEIRKTCRLTYLHFWTCNVSLKREFMLECGMFDETFLYYEDVLCGHKLQENGMQLQFVPQARGQHLHQLKPSGVPAKGRFTGLWLYPFIQRIPDPTAMKRFGILSTDIGLHRYVIRSLRRAAFRLFDNPGTLRLLRLLGATGGKRSKFSDFYYYIIFRRNVVEGYRTARQKGSSGNRFRIGIDSSWANRGES